MTNEQLDSIKNALFFYYQVDDARELIDALVNYKPTKDQVKKLVTPLKWNENSASASGLSCRYFIENPKENQFEVYQLDNWSNQISPSEPFKTFDLAKEFVEDHYREQVVKRFTFEQ